MSNISLKRMSNKINHIHLTLVENNAEEYFTNAGFVMPSEDVRDLLSIFTFVVDKGQEATLQEFGKRLFKSYSFKAFNTPESEYTYALFSPHVFFMKSDKKQAKLLRLTNFTKQTFIPTRAGYKALKEKVCAI